MTAALVVAAVCLLFEAFFSSTELAIVSLDRIKLKQAADEGKRSAKLLLQFLAVPQRLLATTLIGTQLAVVISTVTITIALSSRPYAGLYTLLVLTPVLVIFGEIVPKSLAQQNAERFAPRAIYPLYVASLLFTPIVYVMTLFSSWVARRLGVDAAHKLVTREDLELILKSRPNGGSEITEGERKMIARIFDFSDATVYDVMKPLSSVAGIDETAPIDEVVREMEDKGYTRLPVHRERIDHVVGIVHAFDVLKAGKSNLPLGQIMRPAIYAPENQPAVDLLVELQRQRQGMAVVVDEYGGAVGMVTIEDILEEIVGEIEDEYDVDAPAIRREAEGVWRVRAQTSIREVNQRLHLELPEGDDYETVGGLLLDRLKRIPRAGETVREAGVALRVTAASERAVEEVEVRFLRRR